MKRIILFQCLFCLLASLTSLGQQVTISERNASLEKVFAQLTAQTGYLFFYSDKMIVAAQKVSIDVKNVSLEDVLEKCFYGQPFTYEIINKTVVVTWKNNSQSPAVGKADSVPEIRGIVSSAAGPLEGVSVIVLNTDIGTVTNKKGEFVLHNVNDKATLIFSSVGFEQVREVVGGRKNIQVRMSVAIHNLDETVVIAYGTTTKRLNTGTVSKVTADEIQKQAIVDPLAALQGKVPGLVITQNSGLPGSSFTVRLRGQNSLASGNEPLYIIDGVPFVSTSIGGAGSTGPLSFGISPFSNLNIGDIESIEVLKDADATAIYGSRGANGVILITTKKGKPGDTRVEAAVKFGVATVARRMKLLKTPEYIQMRKEAFANDATDPQPWDYDLSQWDQERNTDWQKQLIGGRANTLNAQLTFSGGSTNTQFSIGGGYYRETTVFPGDFTDQKGSTHITLTHKSANNKFQINYTGSYLVDDNRLPNADLTIQAMILAPNAPALYTPEGKLNWEHSSWENPLAYTQRKFTALSSNFLSSTSIQYEILPDLLLKTNIGLANVALHSKNLTPQSSYDPAYSSFFQSISVFASNRFDTWNLEPQVTWKHGLFGNMAQLEMLAGATFLQQVKESTVQTGIGFSNESLMENIAAANTVLQTGYVYSKYQYSALFGRINFNIRQKYLLNLTGRRDGSSRFGPGKQFENFGAIGAAWIFSSEKGFKNSIKVISFGKIRGSIGKTGNDQIGDYQFLDTYTASGPYQGIVGLTPTRLYNRNFGWETNRKIEIAIELGLWKDRILISSQYYSNQSSNQLVGYALPPTTGFLSIQNNLPATIRNTGFECELNIQAVKQTNFSWSSLINFTIPRNKLLSYPGLEGSAFANDYMVGQSLFIRKVYGYLGVDPLTGTYNYSDIDKSGGLSSADRQTVIQFGPKYYGGWQNSFRYKQWQLDIFLQGVKQFGYNYLRTGFNAPGTMSNQPVEVMQRWQKPGDQVPIQKFTSGLDPGASMSYNNLFYGENAISDASFIRLKNVYLSYLFNERTLHRIHLQNLKLFLQGQNLFTITNYRGLDPESQTVTVLPPLRVISGGIQINL